MFKAHAYPSTAEAVETMIELRKKLNRIKVNKRRWGIRLLTKLMLLSQALSSKWYPVQPYHTNNVPTFPASCRLCLYKLEVLNIQSSSHFTNIFVGHTFNR